MLDKLTKLLLLVFLFSFATRSNAQPYIGMTDSTNQWNFDSRALHPCEKFTYYFKGDTIIGNYTYAKLFKSSINYCSGIPFSYCDTNRICSTTNVFFAGLRDDTLGRKVYAYLPYLQVDTLLYDFDLSVGDTLQDTYFDRYRATHPGIEWIVDSIGFDTIGPNVHRIFYMDTTLISLYYSNNIPRFQLIEGLGSIYGLFENTWYRWFYLHIDKDLLCFTNGQGVFPKGISACNFITSDESQASASQRWSIYPNPTDGLMELSSDHSFVQARIYSLDGKLIHEYSLQENKRHTFRIEGEPGVYILRLQSADGRIESTKVIKK